MKKQFLLLLSTGLLLTTAIIIFRPVPILPEERLSVISGTVEDIFEAGEFDIVLTMKENGNSYYINRGLEQGLSIQDLEKKLINQKVTIKYPDFWSPLQTEDLKHLSKLIYQDQVIYTELKADLVARN